MGKYIDLVLVGFFRSTWPLSYAIFTKWMKLFVKRPACSWFSLNIQIFSIRNWMDNTRVNMASFIALMSILNRCVLTPRFRFVRCLHFAKSLKSCVAQNWKAAARVWIVKTLIVLHCWKCQQNMSVALAYILILVLVSDIYILRIQSILHHVDEIYKTREFNENVFSPHILGWFHYYKSTAIMLWQKSIRSNNKTICSDWVADCFEKNVQWKT